MQETLDLYADRKVFSLRDYQEECLESIVNAKDLGINSQLVVLSTGSGKTVIFAELPDRLNLTKKTLVIAHRQELLEQALDKIERANPHLEVYIEQADRHAPPHADVIIASVATIGRKGSKRLLRLNPDDFGLIIVDEAHHSVASTYKNIFKHFEGVFKIGFTATPKRSDGIGLEKIYEEIVYSKDLRWMITNKYLSDICGYAVASHTDLRNVSTRMGDFALNELSEAVDNDERNQLIVDSYNHLIPGQKAIIFCCDINHSNHVASIFQHAGIHAVSLTGSTSRFERSLMLDDYSKGNLKVLTNCMVLTEGFDEPSIEATIMARPTKSTTLYCQMIGRGMRLYPGKEKLTVIDMADNSGKHSLLSLGGLFGLPTKFNCKGKSILKAVKQFEDLPPHIARQATSFEDFQELVKKVDLFAVPPERDPIISQNSGLYWLKMPDGSYKITLKGKESVVIKSDLLGKNTVELSGEIIAEAPTIKEALNLGDKFVKSRDDAVLYDVNASWRTNKPTKKQLEMMDKLHINYKSDITRGEASALINERFAK